jgi:hypothetical protein
MSNIWDCPFCGQTIEVGTGRLPPNYFETCKLRDHLVGNECIAYRDPEAARRLLLKD